MSDPPPPSAGSGRRAGLGKRAGLAALALVLILAPIYLRVWIDGAAALGQADAAAAAGDLDAELRWLGRAARHRLPLASHDDRARARIVALAETADEDGRETEALACWRELRRAIVATRVFAVDDRARIDRANARIVALMGETAAAAGQPADPARWAAELDEDLAPRTRSLAAAACFALFLLACVGFFVLAIDDKGRLDPRRGTRTGALVLVTLIAWISLM